MSAGLAAGTGAGPSTSGGKVVLHHHHRPTTADYFQVVLVALSHHGCREVVCL